MSLFLLKGCNSCSSDPIPEGSFVGLQLADGYLGSCGNELLNMHVHITVDKYSSTTYEGIYFEQEFDTNNTQYYFDEISIPDTGYFKVTITLESNDCSSCCTGSCPSFSGHPFYEGATNIEDATVSNGTLYDITPHFQACN